MNVFSANEHDLPYFIAFFLTQNFKWKNVFKISPMKNGNTRGQDLKKSYHPNGLVNCVLVQKSIKK